MSDHRRFTASAIAAVLGLAACATPPASTAAADPHRSPLERSPARNVILLIADGSGFNGWLATDYYQGLAGRQSYQTARPDGTEPAVYGMAHFALNLVDEAGGVLPAGADSSLAQGAVEQGYDPTTRWDRLENGFLSDYGGAARRYTSYTDSAAAGTALMSGRKTANGRINVDWRGQEDFRTIAQIALSQGRAAGTVASVMASHATPASAIAHNASRNNYAEIFKEMTASGLDVIMGGGHPYFDASGAALEPDSEAAFQFVGGRETMDALTSAAGLNGYAFIDSRPDFEALAAGDLQFERVVGIARTPSTLQAVREGFDPAATPSGMAFNPDVPDLATMSLGALNVLSQDPDGFFLMIEGGAIDWMGHANNMPRFIEEQIDFNLAVDAVIAWVEAHSSWDETLLIVTSDHETGGVWGEGTWTNRVGGPVALSRSDEALDAARYDPAEDVFNGFLAVQDRGAGRMPGYQFASPNHTNDLVPLWALGPGSEAFAQFSRTDVRAAGLWGEPYGWNGDYVDNTAVFFVMEQALRREPASSPRPGATPR